MKRIIANLLAVGLAVTSLPTSALAAEATENIAVESEQVVEEGVQAEDTEAAEVEEDIVVEKVLEDDVTESETDAEDTTDAEDVADAADAEDIDEVDKTAATADKITILDEDYYYFVNTDKDITEDTIIILEENDEDNHEVAFGEFEQVDATNVYYYTKADVAGKLYGTKAATYSQLYSGITSAADYDAVSSATTGKSALFTSTDVSEVTDAGYYIYGLNGANVAISKESYVKASILDAADVLENAAYENLLTVSLNEDQTAIPSYYLPYDGTSFEKAVIRKRVVVQDAEPTLSYFTKRGTYHLYVNETSTNYLRKTRDNDIYAVNNSVHGAILHGTDANGNTISLGVRHLKELWVSTYEIAIAPETNASVSFEGGYITSVDYLTASDVYTYTFENPVYVKPLYDTTDLKTYFNENDTTLLTVAGLGDDVENATLTLSYTVGKATTKVVDAVEVAVENGYIKYNVTDELTAGTEYKVTITNDKYADIVLTVTPETLDTDAVVEDETTDDSQDDTDVTEGDDTKADTPVISDETAEDNTTDEVVDDAHKQAVEQAVKTIKEVVLPYVCAHWDSVKKYIPTVISYVKSHASQIIAFFFGR